MKRKKIRMGTTHSELAQLQKRISFLAFSFSLVFALIFMFVGRMDVAKGLLLGTCFSIMNFILMGKSLPMILMKSRAGASLVGLGSIFSRYLILAVPLIVAIKSPSFSFVAVVVGIFSVQIVTLCDYVLIKPLLDRQ